MKVIGDKTIFAFQYNLIEKVDKYIFANFCFWVNGDKVGNYDIESAISISLSFLKDFLRNYEYRVYKNSTILNKEALFYELYEQFFQEKSTNHGESKMNKYREVFWLDDVGDESFRDRMGILLLNEHNTGRQRFVWKFFNNETVYEEFIPINYFDESAKVFIDVITQEIEERFS